MPEAAKLFGMPAIRAIVTGCETAPRVVHRVPQRPAETRLLSIWALISRLLAAVCSVGSVRCPAPETVLRNCHWRASLASASLRRPFACCAPTHARNVLSSSDLETPGLNFTWLAAFGATETFRGKTPSFAIRQACWSLRLLLPCPR